MAEFESQFDQQSRRVYYRDFHERPFCCKTIKFAKITWPWNTKKCKNSTNQQKYHGFYEKNRPPWSIFFSKKYYFLTFCSIFRSWRPHTFVILNTSRVSKELRFLKNTLLYRCKIRPHWSNFCSIYYSIFEKRYFSWENWNHLMGFIETN